MSTYIVSSALKSCTCVDLMGYDHCAGRGQDDGEDEDYTGGF